MTKEPRIRAVYQQYCDGQIPFDDVVRAADEILASYEASRTADEAPQPGEPLSSPPRQSQP